MTPSVPIKRLANVTLGKMVQPESKVVSDISAPYLRAAHVQPQGKLIELPDQQMWFSKAELRLLNLRRGDVVVVEGGAGYGRSAVIRYDLPGWGFQNSIIRLRPDARLADGRFLDYALQDALTDGRIDLVTSTATLPHFTADKVSKFEIPSPSLDRQRAIADYLDHETAQIDALVVKQEEFIRLLQERSRAIRREALTPAEGWKRTRIKHLAQTNLGKMLDAGRAPRAGDFPASYVRAADILAGGSVRLTNLYEMPFSKREMHQYELRRNDILIIEGGATVGRPGFLHDDAPGIAFQKTVNRLRPGQDLDARFAYWSLLELYESNYYPNFFGAVSFVHLTGEKLREISLAHPSVDEQCRIGRHIDTQTAQINTLIAKAEEHITLAKERRSALITAAVTGQIDVRTARKVS